MARTERDAHLRSLCACFGSFARCSAITAATWVAVSSAAAKALATLTIARSVWMTEDNAGGRDAIDVALCCELTCALCLSCLPLLLPCSVCFRSAPSSRRIEMAVQRSSTAVWPRQTTSTNESQ